MKAYQIRHMRSGKNRIDMKRGSKNSKKFERIEYEMYR